MLRATHCPLCFAASLSIRPKQLMPLQFCSSSTLRLLCWENSEPNRDNLQIVWEIFSIVILEKNNKFDYPSSYDRCLFFADMPRFLSEFFAPTAPWCRHSSIDALWNCFWLGADSFLRPSCDHLSTICAQCSQHWSFDRQESHHTIRTKTSHLLF